VGAVVVAEFVDGVVVGKGPLVPPPVKKMMANTIRPIRIARETNTATPMGLRYQGVDGAASAGSDGSFCRCPKSLLSMVASFTEAWPGSSHLHFYLAQHGVGQTRGVVGGPARIGWPYIPDAQHLLAGGCPLIAV
jgi:hypothetical protein